MNNNQRRTMPKAKGNASSSAVDSDTEPPCFSTGNVMLLVEKLTANFTSSFSSCVDKIVEAIEKKLDMKIDCQASEIFELHKKVEQLEKQNKNLESINNQLNDKINQINTKLETLTAAIDDKDQYSRNTNLILHGVPSLATPDGHENQLMQHVIQVLNTNLGTTIQESDISTAHRLGKPTSIVASANTSASVGSITSQLSRPSPIIVQFNSKNVRNETLRQRKRLKGKGISINEQLTTRRASLLKRSSELVAAKRLDSAWSHDWRIIVKTLNHRTIVVHSEIDLANF